MLPLHTVSEWSAPVQTSFRHNLPPTPSSPFRPLDPLSEDMKAAFPCTGTAEDCWNLELCPKHKQWPKVEQPPTPPEYMQSRPMPHNPRRRSAPALDWEPPPTKMKRHATEPEEADPENPERFHHASISRDTRATVPRGRVPHNLVERRYRDNLNNQIEALRLTLPSLRDAQPCLDALEDPSGPRMPSKAVIISTAAIYIRETENERARLLAANTALQEQVRSLQKLVGCDDCSILQYLNAMQLNAHAIGGGEMPTPS
ncbi:hypothetical protein DOTSEDRAFT_39855 [Dothistroma septosporum NZE10]|uniref:BHLH domain-containing protein n=1 Tax=Dothistroma septosporum (strain NZE10 / CBS 128990) TaxID=675120 RepID=N1PZU4_DOTSN|nr:hypothetical protein DOTSEDRAFT_39855 [Dothistroma septosporum NZE10]